MTKIKLSFVASVGQRQSLSSRRGSSLWSPRYWMGALTTELREALGELGHLLVSYTVADPGEGPGGHGPPPYFFRK